MVYDCTGLPTPEPGFQLQTRAGSLYTVLSAHRVSPRSPLPKGVTRWRLRCNRLGRADLGEVNAPTLTLIWHPRNRRRRP